MQRNVLLPRLMPADIAAWGTKVFGPDDGYKHFGDTHYAELYAAHAQHFAVLPSPPDLTPFDMACVIALQMVHRFAPDDVAHRLKADLSWKYALRMPLMHGGCTGHDVQLFWAGLTNAQPSRVPYLMQLVEAFQRADPFVNETPSEELRQFWKKIGL